MRTILFSIIAVMMLHAGALSAQLLPNANTLDLSQFGYNELVAVSMTPQYPKPGDTVKINVRSTTSDLGRSAIGWMVNGEMRKQATGGTNFEVIAGKLGERTTVEMVAITQDGKRITETILIVPTEVDLIWQADTATPPFYKGKAMFTPQSVLTVVAMPHIKIGEREADASELMYTWNMNGTPLGDRSGYGRDVLEVPVPLLWQPLNIEVTVSTLDQKTLAYGKTSVQYIVPKVIAYQDHPLFGVMLERAIVGSFEMTGREVSITAYPYFFSPEPYGPVAKLTWLQNNKQITGGTQGDIVFRNEEGKSGRSQMTLRANHASKPQAASTQFTLMFKEEGGEDL